MGSSSSNILVILCNFIPKVAKTWLKPWQHQLSNIVVDRFPAFTAKSAQTMASTSAEKTKVAIILWNSDFVPFEMCFCQLSSLSSLVELEKSFWQSAGFLSSQSVLADVQEVWCILVVCLPVSSSSVSSKAVDSAAFNDGFWVCLGPDRCWVLVMAPFWWPMVAGGHCGRGWALSTEQSLKDQNLMFENGKWKWAEEWSFFRSFLTYSEFDFWEMEEKWKLKMKQKWPKNGYCEQPYWHCFCHLYWCFYVLWLNP